MRVLLLNRTDARSNPGGDTVQMEKTRDALQRLGAEVHVGDDGDPLMTSGHTDRSDDE